MPEITSSRLSSRILVWKPTPDIDEFGHCIYQNGVILLNLPDTDIGWETPVLQLGWLINNTARYISVAVHDSALNLASNSPINLSVNERLFYIRKDSFLCPTLDYLFRYQNVIYRLTSIATVPTGWAIRGVDNAT